MPITYTIAIDRNDDGDYSDLSEAIQADVLSVRWRLGLDKRYDTLAAPSSAEITVRNRTGTYSPERNSLVPAKRVRIQSNDGTTTRTHFIGAIERIEPLAGEYSRQTAVIHVVGREVEVAENRVRLLPMIDVTADEVVNAIFDRLTLRYAVLENYCILDRSGHNVINSTTIFPADAVTRNFDTGKSTFAYVGDNWSTGIAADIALREVLDSEGGRFFFKRDGEAIFYNRHHLFTTLSTQATFTDDMDGLDYVYGADRITQVDVRLRPRSIGVANSLLWSLAQAIKIKRGATRTLITRYEVDSEPVGLLSTLTVNHTALITQLVGGVDVSDSVQVVVMDAGFSAATIEVRNHAASDIYLHTLNLYGTPLLTGDILTLSESDALAQSLYGVRVLEVDLPTLTDVEEAAAIATYELQRRSSPRGLITELQTSTRTHPTETLSLTLFDRIKIVEAQSGHSGFYRIVSETHTVDKGGSRHRVAWLAEPDDSEIFFVIDTHDVDGDEVLLPR
ncbi:MAG: hypothetical protein Q9P44_18845 [Anaerolineae bacterium]|nr:hypothetical protein [Anaerolineae bacterium]